MATRPLRIAVWHNLPSGGAKRALHDHVRGLVERGHHVEAWCTPSAEQTYLPLSEFVKEHVVAMKLRPAVPVRAAARVGIHSNGSWRIRALDAHCRAVAAQIGTGFDVLLAGSCQVSAAAPIGRHVSIPAVLYLQEPNRRIYEALPTPLWMEGRAALRAARRMARFERANAEAYDRVLVNSYFSRESVARAYGITAHTCYLGVDAELFRPSAKATRDYFVGVGTFTRAKNIEMILSALAAVTPAPPPLVWVGNGVESHTSLDDLTRLADRLGVPFTAKLRASDDELVQLVAGARAMVCAPRLEPFGYGPLEANACGVPVIGVAEGGLRESIIPGVNGLLVEPTRDALRDAIASLWTDPRAAKALGRRARAHVSETWSLAAATARVEHHLTEVAAA
jgi:glycosyltransferase involved in cell wall biosynthesis